MLRSPAPQARKGCDKRHENLEVGHIVMEAIDGWSRLTEKYIDKVNFRYTVRKGMTAVAAKINLGRRFIMALWRIQATSLHKRMANPAFRTIRIFGHFGHVSYQCYLAT